MVNKNPNHLKLGYFTPVCALSYSVPDPTRAWIQPIAPQSRQAGGERTDVQLLHLVLTLTKNSIYHKLPIIFPQMEFSLPLPYSKMQSIKHVH